MTERLRRVCRVVGAAAVLAWWPSSARCQDAAVEAPQPATPAVAAPAVAAVVRPAEPIIENRRLSESGLPGLEKKVMGLESIKPMEVVQVIESLAHVGGLSNIVIGKGVAGLTTRLKFDDVTVGHALEVVLSVNQLAYVVKDGIVTIMTDEEYKALYGRSFYDSKQIRIVPLKYADAVRVQTMLGPVKSAIGTVVSDPVTGNLILIDTPEKIREMMGVIEKADIATVSRVLPTKTQTFVLQYGTVEEIEGKVQQILTKDGGSLSTDRRTKTLIVTDLPHNMDRIQRLVELFDQPPKQVYIDAQVSQVKLNDSYRMGIRWDHVYQGSSPRFSLSTVSRPFSLSDENLGSSDILPRGTLSYNTILGGGDFHLVLETLKTFGETKILSNPHVTVKDGQAATIKVITDQPYAEAQLESGTTNVVGEDIKFIEVGTILGVTPRINDERMITMDIKPEISTVVGKYAAFRSVPIVRKSFAETSIVIQDGEMIVIGGMIESETTVTETKVPILGSIPLLGVLFRSKTDETSNNELVVSLMPRIVTGREPVPRLPDLKKPAKGLRGDTLGMNSTRGKESRPAR